MNRRVETDHGECPAHLGQLHQPVRPGVGYCVGFAATLLQGERGEQEGGHVVRRPRGLEIRDILLALAERRRCLVRGCGQARGVDHDVAQRYRRGRPPRVWRVW